ncbi:hypothetical protein X947_4031 [Burkholderia pseudomallei MSHR7334]|nr:hypothetical protein X947_4031 [Burkholderia pseudomallei MSHR7334]
MHRRREPPPGLRPLFHRLFGQAVPAGPGACRAAAGSLPAPRFAARLPEFVSRTARQWPLKIAILSPNSGFPPVICACLRRSFAHLARIYHPQPGMASSIAPRGRLSGARLGRFQSRGGR